MRAICYSTNFSYLTSPMTNLLVKRTHISALVIFFCTKGFVDLFFSEFLLNDLNRTRARQRIICHYLRCGCSCAELLPEQQSTFWIELLEIVIYSKAMLDRRHALLLELVKHEDCTHCAVDNLTRPTRRIAGQEDCLVGKKKRNAAPIPDSGSYSRCNKSAQSNWCVYNVCSCARRECRDFEGTLHQKHTT